MKIIILFIVMFSLSGCCSDNLQKTQKNSIFHFIDKYIPKLQKYIQEDSSLSIRDKNTFLIQMNDYKEKRKLFQIDQK